MENAPTARIAPPGIPKSILERKHANEGQKSLNHFWGSMPGAFYLVLPSEWRNVWATQVGLPP